MTVEIFDIPASDFILRSGAKEFHVHRSLLSLSSSFFDQMLSLPQPPPKGPKEIPVVDVSEPSRVLQLLLQFIYPVSDPIIDDDLDTLLLVLHAAVKYEVLSAIQSLRRQLVSERYLKQSPTRLYAVAVYYDFEQEAKLASKHTLGISILDVDGPLPEELRFISAESYHRLLVLRHARAKAAKELLQLREDVKCMECNGTYGAFSAGPKWWLDFQVRAAEELSLRPTTEVIFTMEFLSKSFEQELKRKIDELPATV